MCVEKLHNIKFTIYHFKLYRSVAVSMFTLLGNNFFILQSRKPILIKQLFIPSPLKPWCSPILLLLLLFGCLFLAVLGLGCSAQAFSSCSNEGLLSSCGERASHCSGFFCCGAQSPGCLGSAVMAHRLSCPMACGIFLD